MTPLPKTFPTIIYFQTGTVGDFLMALHFADQVKKSAELQNKACPRIVIPVRRNAMFLRQLSVEYKHVQVVPFSNKELIAGLQTLLSQPGPRLAITWSTLGWVPLRLKIIARLVAGFRGTLAGFEDGYHVNTILYNQLWKFDHTIPMHQSMCLLAERIGYEAPCVPPALCLSVKSKKGDYILFHIFPAEPSRTWAAARWNSFLKKARAQWPDTPFIFSGAPSDRSFIESAMSDISLSENMAGKYNAAELVGAVDGARVVVTVDTGAAHIAAFRRRPLVVVGTNRTPFWWATYSPNTVWLAAPCSCGFKKNCLEVNEDGVARLQCVTNIADNEVLSAIAAKVNNTAS
jgi:hypothetical protein